MNINNRVQDIEQAFNRNWNVNRNNQQRQEFLDSRKEHFKRMYNIKDKEDKKQEMLKATSVNGQVESLNSRMSGMIGSQNRFRLNDFKNNFR